MTDIFTSKKRSEIMSKIHSRNTDIELILMTELRRSKIKGFKYQEKITGNPDFVFKDQKVVVFCDGDFWHWYKFKTWKDKLNKFWQKKIANNICRDMVVNLKLKKEGWTVVRLWGHTIKQNPSYCIKKIKVAIGK